MAFQSMLKELLDRIKDIIGPFALLMLVRLPCRLSPAYSETFPARTGAAAASQAWSAEPKAPCVAGGGALHSQCGPSHQTLGAQTLGAQC